MPVISEVSFVPRVDGDGSLGTESKKWDKVYSNEVVTDLVTSSTINTSTVNSTAVYDESNIRSYGAIGDGATDDTGALEAAIAHFDGADATILFQKGEYVIADDVTIPENICLKFEKGGKVVVSDTFTLAINGPIEAGLWHIFDGDGTVTGSPKIEHVYPEWFGAVGDGETDDTVPIQKTLDSFVGSEIVFIQNYSTSLGIEAPVGSNLSGNGHFYLTDISKDCVKHLGNGYIKGLSFHGDGTYDLTYSDGFPPALLKIVGSTVTVEGCYFENPPTSGVFVSETSNVKILNNKLECDYSGEWGNHFMVYTRVSSDILVQGNTIVGGVQGVCGGGNNTDIYLMDVFVDNNRITGQSDHSVYFSNWSKGMHITNNHLVSGHSPVKIEGGPNIVSGNYIEATNSGDVAGINGRNIYDTHIQGNTVVCSNQTGLNAYSVHLSDNISKIGMYNVSVIGNIIKHGLGGASKGGILVSGNVWDSYQSVLSNIIINDNIIEGYGTSPVPESTGIRVLQMFFSGSPITGDVGNNIQIMGNIIKNMPGARGVDYGVLLQGLSGCMVANNTLTSIHHINIRILGVSNSIFTGNLFKDKGLGVTVYGFYERPHDTTLYYNSTNNLYVGNRIDTSIIGYLIADESTRQLDVKTVINNTANPGLTQSMWPSKIVMTNTNNGYSITIPTNANFPWPLGYELEIFNEHGSNTFTVNGVDVEPNTSVRFINTGSNTFVKV